MLLFITKPKKAAAHTTSKNRSMNIGTMLSLQTVPIKGAGKLREVKGSVTPVAALPYFALPHFHIINGLSGQVAS